MRVVLFRAECLLPLVLLLWGQADLFHRSRMVLPAQVFALSLAPGSGSMSALQKWCLSVCTRAYLTRLRDGQKLVISPAVSAYYGIDHIMALLLVPHSDDVSYMFRFGGTTQRRFPCLFAVLATKFWDHGCTDGQM